MGETGEPSHPSRPGFDRSVPFRLPRAHALDERLGLDIERDGIQIPIVIDDLLNRATRWLCSSSWSRSAAMLVSRNTARESQTTFTIPGAATFDMCEALGIRFHVEQLAFDLTLGQSIENLSNRD